MQKKRFQQENRQNYANKNSFSHQLCKQLVKKTLIFVVLVLKICLKSHII